MVYERTYTHTNTQDTNWWSVYALYWVRRLIMQTYDQ